MAVAERSIDPPTTSLTIGVRKANGCVTDTVTWLPMPPAKFEAAWQSTTVPLPGVKQVGSLTVRPPAPPWACTFVSRTAAATMPAL